MKFKKPGKKRIALIYLKKLIKNDKFGKIWLKNTKNLIKNLVKSKFKRIKLKKLRIKVNSIKCWVYR